MDKSISIMISFYKSIDIDFKISYILECYVNHHMIFDSQYFLKNMSSSDSLHNYVVDGSHTRVDDCEDIDLQSHKFKYVFHIHVLLNKSSIFICKLIEDNNCVVTFFVLIAFFKILQ